MILKRLKKVFYACRSKRLFRALVGNGVIAGTEHRHILKVSLSTIIDIGANRGQFALAARKCAPNARVVAFEPLATASIKFRNVFKQDSEVTLHQAAIGLEVGESTIHVAAADDSSSLLPISPLQERFFPGTYEIRTEIVKVGRLSNYVQPEQIVPPAMLKLDVQGYELEALRGCEDLLGRFSYVYAECSFVELYTGQALVDDIIAWLTRTGLVPQRYLQYDLRSQRTEVFKPTFCSRNQKSLASK